MATLTELRSLRHFQPHEFKRADLLHFPFLVWLDAVRDRAGLLWQRFGTPGSAPMRFQITSDGRTHVPKGGSPTSLHLRGRAVDLKFPYLPSGKQDGARVAIIIRAALEISPPPHEGGREIGIEPGAAGGPHLHLGLYGDGRPDWLFVK